MRAFQALENCSRVFYDNYVNNGESRLVFSRRQGHSSVGGMYSRRWVIKSVLISIDYCCWLVGPWNNLSLFFLFICPWAVSCVSYEVGFPVNSPHPAPRLLFFLLMYHANLRKFCTSPCKIFGGKKAMERTLSSAPAPRSIWNILLCRPKIKTERRCSWKGSSARSTRRLLHPLPLPLLLLFLLLWRRQVASVPLLYLFCFVFAPPSHISEPNSLMRFRAVGKMLRMARDSERQALQQALDS